MELNENQIEIRPLYIQLMVIIKARYLQTQAIIFTRKILLGLIFINIFKHMLQKLYLAQ